MNLKQQFSLCVFLRLALQVTLIFISLFVFGVAYFYFWGGAGSLPPEKMSEIIFFEEVKKSTPPPKATQQVFTLFNYNMGYLSGMTNNKPVIRNEGLFKRNMRVFLERVNKLQPDFIVLQEVDFNSRRSFYIDQAATVCREAGYPYLARSINWDRRYVPFPYWPPAVHFGRMLSGQAVLGRWPLLSCSRVLLEKPADQPFYYKKFYLDRLVQVVKADAAGQDIIILNVHLESRSMATRHRQIQVVLDVYRAYKDRFPVLLVGDFNAPPPDAPQKKDFEDDPTADYSGDQTIATLMAEPGLAALEIATVTFPSRKPNRKLDYIFYNRDKIIPHDGFVLMMDCSDHLPVFMQFSLAPVPGPKKPLKGE